MLSYLFSFCIFASYSNTYKDILAMKSYAKLFIGLAGLSLGLTACTEDYFDAEAYDNLVKKAFPVENVDPNHTWASFGTADISVSVNTNAGKEYRVVVYKENPLAHTSLTKLTEETIIAGTPKVLHFSYELANSWVYVALYNEKDERTVRGAKLIKDGTVDIDFFGSRAQARSTRSQAAPTVPNITVPYDAAWVTEYLETAKEPNDQNINDNYDNAYWVDGTPSQWVVDQPASQTTATTGQIQWGGVASQILYNWGSPSDEDRAWFEENCRPVVNYTITDWNDNAILNAYIDLVMATYQKCQDTGRTDWMTLTGDWVKGTNTEEVGHWTEATEGHWVADENFVTNFKITGTYTGSIGVAASEGYATSYGQNGEVIYGERLEPFLARTIVVTGTWNINNFQRMGSGSLIVIANGGTVNVAANTQLQTVNQARIVVLPGGTLTGEGYVEVSNGNGDDAENYNGGIVSVAKFNNNFGKFYNYGQFLVREYVGGAKESNFYNHGLVHIQYTGLNNETPNARIFNACQWYCENNMRCRNYEGVQGSSFIIDGELMMSVSEDGTSDLSYVGLEAGALVKCGSLYNNGTSWSGPVDNGYAVVSIGTITYLNWAQDTWPLESGYFENNIYVELAENENIPLGNGMQAGDEATAKYKFWNIVANGLDGGSEGRGNGNVTEVKATESDDADVLLPADPDYQKGVRGCTPGYKGSVFVDPGEEDIKPQSWRFCFEDNFPSPGDYDFNDCVITVMQPEFTGTNQVTLTVRLDAVGGIKQLAGALHIDGLKQNEVNVIAAVNNMDEMSYELIPATQNPYGAYVVDPDTIYDYGRNDNPANKDVVIRLFDDAHLSMARGATNSYGMVSRIFYNTVASWNTDYTDRAEVEPREVVFYITVKDGVDITEKFSIDKLDIFIVESHGSIKYEVHTFPYKFLQVLKPYAGPHKYDAYMELSSKNYPWALCMDGSFKYPNEWYSISGTKMEEGEDDNYGYTDAAYPLFHFWAQDRNSNEDWYLEENANPRYIHE